METKIKVDNLSKTYHTGNINTIANKNISFEIAAGTLVWIRGRSGSGKTTLMNMLTGLANPDQGDIEFFGTNYRDLNEHKRTDLRLAKMGLMFQHFELLPMLSGYENIRLPLFLGKQFAGSVQDLYNKAKDIVTQVRPDTDFLQKKSNQISGGQKQIINIVRALVYDAPFIIGDEITSNLDREQAHKIYALLQKSTHEKNGITVLISHDPIIEQYCDRIFTMDDGALTAQEKVNA